MKRSNIILAALGALAAIGGFLLVLLSKADDSIMTPAFLVLGLGCGLFGHNLGTLLSQRAAHSCPERARQIAVEQKDERNIALNNLAKAKAYNGMIYIFAALLIVFAAGRVAAWAVLVLVAAYLAVVFLYVYYLNKYQKEM